MQIEWRRGAVFSTFAFRAISSAGAMSNRQLGPGFEGGLEVGFDLIHHGALVVIAEHVLLAVFGDAAAQFRILLKLYNLLSEEGEIPRWIGERIFAVAHHVQHTADLARNDWQAAGHG